MKVITVHDPVYTATYKIVYGAPFKQFASLVKHTCNEILEDSSCDGLCFVSSKPNYIWVYTEERKLTILIHELHHAMFRVLDSRGIKLNRETEEVYAYYIEYLTNAILSKGGNNA
jgi:hypothetical protein